MNLLRHFLRVLTGYARGLDKAKCLKRETRTLKRGEKRSKSGKLKILDGTCHLLRIFAYG